MKIIVCGGRKFEYPVYVAGALDAYMALVGDSVQLVAHGGARGVDTFAEMWAKERGIPVQAFPISQQEWDLYKQAAGPIRNKRMLLEVKPDVVVAFPGDRGTEDMVKRAMKAGAEVMVLPGPGKGTPRYIMGEEREKVF